MKYYRDRKNCVWRCSEDFTVIEHRLYKLSSWKPLRKGIGWKEVLEDYSPLIEITEEDAILELI